MKQVKCTTCKHIIELEDAQIIKHTELDGVVVNKIYCPEHKVNYDRSVLEKDCWGLVGIKFFKETQVNKDGSMILPFGKKLVDEYRIILNQKSWVEKQIARETTVAYVILGVGVLGLMSLLLISSGFTCHF